MSNTYWSEGEFFRPALPPTQLKNLVRGVIWCDEHFSGMSMKAIAEREGLSKAGVQKIIMGSFDTLMSF